MRSPAPLIVLLTTACILVSCKKDGQSPNEGTILFQEKNLFNDGTIQKLKYERDAADKLLRFRDSSTLGWVETINFEYGTDGRISKANYNNYHQGGILYYFEFEYNGNGTIRKRQDRPGTLNLADDYHTYAYDNSGHLVADSVFARYGAPPSYQLSSVNKFIYTGDNVTESEYYTYYTGATVLEGRRKFDYDQGFNPYKNVDNYFFIVAAAFNIDQAKYLSSNNVIKHYAADQNLPYQLLYTYTYKYNSSNYPWKLKMEATNQTNGAFDTEFFYKQ